MRIIDFMNNNRTPDIALPFMLYAAADAGTPALTQVFSRTNYGYFTAEYVLSGAGYLKINGKKMHICKDSVYFLTPGSDHHYWPDRKDPWLKLFFVLNGSLIHTLLDMYNLKDVYHIPDCPELKKYFEDMINISHNLETSNPLASLIFHQFIQDASRHCSFGAENNLPEEIRMLKRELDYTMEESFSLEHFASQVKYSEAHLIRLFHSHFGVTPYEYRMNWKMEQARRLLMYSSLTIKEIASKLVFADQYYFSNYFKLKNGMSPREYRKRFQA